MEQREPKFENELTKEAVISAIKEKGLDNPEALALLMAWITANQEKAEADPAMTSRIKLQLEIAELLISAGEVREGKEILYEQFDVAEEEGARSTNPNPECAKLAEDIKARLSSL